MFWQHVQACCGYFLYRCRCLALLGDTLSIDSISMAFSETHSHSYTLQSQQRAMITLVCHDVALSNM